MNKNLYIGTFFEIPVYLHWTLLFLIPMALTAANPLNSAICIFVAFLSVLLHEFGHALAAKHVGYKVPSITLMILGGVANIRSYSATPLKDLFVTIMGPLVTLAIFILSLLEFRFSPFFKDFTSTICLINLSLFIFNMLPIHPMDGGRLLKNVCDMYFTKNQVFKITTIVGVGTAIIVFCIFLWLKMFFGAFVIAIIGWVNFMSGYKKLDI